MRDGTTNVGTTTTGFTPEGYPTTVKVIRPGEATTTDYRSYDTDGLQDGTNTIVAGGASIPRTYQWGKGDAWEALMGCAGGTFTAGMDRS